MGARCNGGPLGRAFPGQTLQFRTWICTLGACRSGGSPARTTRILITTAFPDIPLFAPKTPNPDYFVGNGDLIIFTILPTDSREPNHSELAVPHIPQFRKTCECGYSRHNREKAQHRLTDIGRCAA